jgi:formylglycine-generating enzyme required for sulfatase activity
VHKSVSIIIVYLLCVPAFAAEIPETVVVVGGPFMSGSDTDDREYGYQLDEAAYGHSVTRKQHWYENETPKTSVDIPAFEICQNLVTNAEFAEFITDTGAEAPMVSKAIWESYGLLHAYRRTQKFQWQDGRPPPGREDHPVVLVDWDMAVAYADWLSMKTGENWRLPTALQWEKAARGPDGLVFPWGNEFDPDRLNSHDTGPFDTVPVGQFPEGASPYGALDMAGQVFEWTATIASENRAVVKGGSWDDKGCGVCRSAAWHTRPTNLKHILIGFRLVKED